MSVTAPPPAYAVVRAAAAAAVTAVTSAGRYLDNALNDARGHYPLASAADQAMLQELAYGTLRWHTQLDAVARRLLHRPLAARDADLQALLLIGLYQLRHQQVADALVVDATVEAATLLNKPWAKGMLNACLRRAQRERPTLDEWIASKPERRYSHPPWFIDQLRSAYPERWATILDANNARPPLTMRINTRRTSVVQYVAELEAGTGLRAHPITEISTAVIIDPPVAVERLPGFREGLLSVQDAAAQLAAPVLDARPGDRVLDACAAPGGKACHLLEHTPDVAELVAIDTDARRLVQLRQNLDRLGLTATVAVADATDTASWWDGRGFDRILLDAPCSATGVIRRHPDIKVRRRADDLPRLVQTQRRLLDALWPLLAPGGKLLYVTCSVLPVENNGTIGNFLAAHTDARIERPDTVIGQWRGTGLQILPGDQNMDGFYYALVHKH